MSVSLILTKRTDEEGFELYDKIVQLGGGKLPPPFNITRTFYHFDEIARLYGVESAERQKRAKVEYIDTPRF